MVARGYNSTRRTPRATAGTRWPRSPSPQMEAWRESAKLNRATSRTRCPVCGTTPEPGSQFYEVYSKYYRTCRNCGEMF